MERAGKLEKLMAENHDFDGTLLGKDWVNYQETHMHTGSSTNSDQ